MSTPPLTLTLRGKTIPVTLPKIDLSGKNIRSLTEIRGLDNVEEPIHLNLRDNLLSSLDNVPFSKYVEVLALVRNNLTSLKGIEYFPNLRRLDVMGNKITEISHLDGCPHLEHLSLANNRITKIEGLTHLPNLISLGLNKSSVCSASARAASRNPIEELGGTDENGFINDIRQVYNYCNGDEGPWLL